METFHNKNQNKSWKFRFGAISFLSVLILLTSLSFILAVILFLRSPAKENEAHLPPATPPSVPIAPTPLSNNNSLDVSSLLELFSPRELNSDGFMPLDDFFGADEIKDKLKDYVHRWRPENKKEYDKITNKPLGLPFPMGIIFYGPPGTGKTTLAEAFAKDSKMNFYPITNAHTLKEIEDIWRKARNNSPSCIFVDEAEEILKSRAEKDAKLLEDGDSKKTNTFLQEIEGVKTDKEKPVFFIAATNHLDKIDSAIRSRCEPLYIGNQPEDKRLGYIQAVITKMYKLNIDKTTYDHYIKRFVDKMNTALRHPELFAIAIKNGYYIPALGTTEIKGISDNNNPKGNLEILEDKLKTQDLLYKYARVNNEEINDLYKKFLNELKNNKIPYKDTEWEDFKVKLTTYLTKLPDKDIKKWTDLKDTVITYLKNNNLPDKDIKKWTDLEDTVTTYLTELPDKDIKKWTDLEDTVTTYLKNNNLPDKDIKKWTDLKDTVTTYLTKKELPYDIETLEKVKKYFYDLTSGRKINAMLLNAAERAVRRGRLGTTQIIDCDLEETFKEYFGNQTDFAKTNTSRNQNTNPNT